MVFTLVDNSFFIYDSEKMKEKPDIMAKPDYRIARIAMLTLVTGATAFGLSGDVPSALFALFSGLGTALAGFYLDHVLDRGRDAQSGGGANPLALGTMRLPAALALIAAGLALAIALALIFRPLALVPAILVIGVVLLLHVRWAATAFVRAAGLGALQGLYAILGAAWAGAPVPRAAWLAAFLLFAMAGGKVLGDIRDLNIDDLAGTQTIPRRFGIGFARVFLCVNEGAAYLTGIAAYFFAGFGLAYLIAMLATAAAGTVFNVYFCLDPTPARARFVNNLSLSVLGTLYIAAMAAEGISRWI
jgi:4-hydroxybenzoate polyprenyltransferase